MIEKIRKPKKSRNIVNYTVYAVIFGMIIATFVFMIPGLGDGGGAVNSAAEVGSKSISLRAYTDQLRATRSNYARLFNGEIPAPFEQGLKRQVLEGLVKKAVLNDFALKNSLRVSELEISDFIKKDIPAFQEDGVFSYSRYSSYLTNTRSNAQKFEKLIAEDMMSQNLSRMIESSLSKLKQEEELNKQAEGVEVQFSYLELTEEALNKAVNVKAEDIEAFVKDSSNQNKLTDHYAQIKERFKTPAEVELSYILIKDEKKANALASELTTENFSDLAKLKSEDPLSKSKGGALGFIKRGGFSPEIEAKAFDMKENEISKPFKTGLGYAILKTGQKKMGGTKKLEEVKSEVAKELIAQKSSVELKKEFLNLSKADSKAALAQKLKEANLSWTTDQKFDLGATSLPGIGPSDEIMSKILNLKSGAVHPNIVSFSDREFFVRLDKLSSKNKQATTVAQNNTPGRGRAFLDFVYENEKKDLNIQLNQQILDQ